MDNIDEQAVRRWLTHHWANPFDKQEAAAALALLDAKDAEIAEYQAANDKQAGWFSSGLCSVNNELDEARAQYAAAQAAMVEAVRRAKDHYLPGECRDFVFDPLQPHLPQPAPDPLVEALGEALGGMRGTYGKEDLAPLLRQTLAARGLHITEKKP